MLFDTRPKNRQSDMYGVDKEIGDLYKYIESKTPGIIIKGIRRAGKTSILQTVLNEGGKLYISVDMRDLGSKKSISKKSVIGTFQSSMNVFLNENKAGKQKLVDYFKNVSGVSFMGTGMQFGWQKGREVDLAQTFRELDRWAKENNSIVVIAIDEAQILGQSKHYNVTGILATIYDSCQNLVMVLTGSTFKLLDEFLDLKNPNSSLYGRYFKKIQISRLTKNQSIEMLRRGFMELDNSFKSDPNFDDVINEAASKLGGIMGWLVMFGADCSTQSKISKDDILSIQKMGANLAGQEFKNFLGYRKGTKKYRDIMKFVAKSPRTWTDIKKMLMEKTTGISDSNVALLIDTLSKNGFLDNSRKTKKYIVPDPLLELFFRQQSVTV